MLGFLLIIFAWFTDTHLNATQDRYNAFADGLADAYSQQAQFAVVTGDLTDFGTNDEVQQYQQALGTAHFPVYSLSGNHDQKWSQTGGLYFRELLGDDRFCFDYGGIKYIGLPSGPVLRIGGDRVSKETLNWLKTQLEQTSFTQKIIVFIHHPLSIGSLSNGYEVTEMLKPYNVQVILAGHVHSYSNTAYDGIPAITTQQSYNRQYTLVEVNASSVQLYTRTIGGTKALLTTVPLGTFDRSSGENTLPRPAYTINQTYSFVKRRWTYSTDVSIYNSPAVSGNRLVVADAAGIIRCFNWSTGVLAWTYDTKTTLYASPSIKDGKIFIGGMDQQVYCLQLSDGTCLWKKRLDGSIMAGVQVTDAAVYVATCVNPRIHALDPTDGRILWSSSTLSGHVEASPLVVGNRLYIGSWDGYVNAFSLSTGASLWRSKVGNNRYFSAASQTPLLIQGNVFLSIPTNSGANMLALDTLTGNLSWKSTENLSQSIGISEDRQTCFVKGFYHIRALRTASLNAQLTKIWETRHSDNYDESGSGLVEKGGNVFFGTSRGYVGAINTSSGSLQWQHRVSANLVHTPVPIDEKRVAVTTTDGKVYVLEQTMLFNPLRLLNYSPLKGIQNEAYEHTFGSSGAEGTAMFFIREGGQALPQGIGLDSLTGQLKGTPTQAGRFRFTVTVMDREGNYDAQYIEWVIDPDPTGSPSLPLLHSGWKVFPNPIRSGNTVFLQPVSGTPSLPPSTILDISVYTSFGRLVQQFRTLPSGSIPLKPLLPGIYFIIGQLGGKVVFSEQVLYR